MIKQPLIAPSTEPCPVKDLTAYVKSLEQDGADWIHCDIMDGKMVPARTFDYLVLAFLRKATNLPLDVHLMIQNPLRVIREYVKYGADIITVHFESFEDKFKVIDALNQIRNLGIKAGVSIKPSTPVEVLDSVLPHANLVLIMSVEPGKSGQQFIKDSLVKIAYLNRKRDEQKLNFYIEVDGGINAANAPIISVSGADVLVSGSAVFNSTDRKKIMNELRGKPQL